MRSIRNQLRLCSLCLAFAALPAQAADANGPPALRAGEWQVNSGTVGQPSVAYRLCLKTGGPDDLKLLLPQVKGSACPAAGMRMEGGTLLWEMSCPAANLAISARYAVQAQRVEGSVEIVSGTPPQKRLDRISASYAGDCAAP